MINKVFAFIILFSTMAMMLTISVSADDTELPSEYYELVEELPQDISERLPEEIYSEDTVKVAEGIEKLVSAEYLIDFLSSLFEVELGASLVLLGRLCGLLLISAVFAAFKSSIASATLSNAFGFCTTCAMFGAIVETLNVQMSAVSLFFERLNSLMVGMVPITCSVWAIGGNVSTAANAAGTLYAFLAVSEVICAKGIIPVCSLCTVFAICRGVSPTLRLEGFSSAIRRCYTFLIGLIMTILLAVLSSQSILSSSADTIGARGAKMITATIIPVVGGSVSETLRTLGASVQYIKSVIGVSAIAFIVILLLPTLISLIVRRFVYLIAGSVADLLGCERESRLICEIGNVSGFMIAVVSMCSVMFILGFNIFIRTTVAVG